MISVSHLTRMFDTHRAVNDISFEVKPGDVVGFLGPNGAGKSTTMKMLTGYLTPTSGEILVKGKGFENDALAIKQAIGYLPEGAPSYPNMTVYNYLKFIAQIRGFKGEAIVKRLANVVNQVELTEVMFKTIDTLSKGFKRRVGIAQAIIHDPEILILDEPTDGLDPNQKHQVRQLIKSMSKDKIIIISTHILEEVSAVCNRAMIIDHGNLVFDGTPLQLVQMSEQHHSIRLALHSELDKDLFTGLDGLREIRRDDNGDYLLLGDGTLMLPVLVSKMNENQIQASHIELQTGKLDEVFRNLTLGVQA